MADQKDIREVQVQERNKKYICIYKLENSLSLSIFTTVPDRVCLTALKKFAEFLLIFLQILQFFRALGLSRTQGALPGPRAVPPPKKLQNLQIKISRISANFFKTVRHRLSGTVVKILRQTNNHYGSISA